MTENELNIDGLDDWKVRNSSWLSMMSYAFGAFAIEMVGNSYGSLYFFFYETELLIAGGFLVAAQVLFAIWNAVNDPLIGFITEKQRPYWKRWGKRGLWLATSIIPMYVAYALVFNPPQFIHDSNWGLFIWLFIMLALADTFYSIFYVHWMGQFPEKYPTDKLKRKGNVWRLYLAILAVVVGNLVPPEIYHYGDIGSFGRMAIIIGILGCFGGVMAIYGTRQSPRRIALDIASDNTEEKSTFMQYMKLGLSTKSYVAYLCFYFGNKIWDLFVIGTVPYYNKYILGRPAGDSTLLLALFIVGQLISVPFWTIVSKKIGFRKGMIISGFTQAITTIPFLFVRNYTLAIPFFVIAGFGNGGMWTHLAPVFSETLDELSIKTRKRDSGVFVGINTFFGRFTIILFTVFTVIVHNLTGFDAEADMGTTTQTPEAKNGIQFLLAGIPVIGLTIAIGLFAWLYDIKGDKKKWIEQQKLELGL